MDNCLVETLLDQAQLGMKVDKSFKAPAYTDAATAIRIKFGIDCYAQHIKNRMKMIKKNFVVFREMFTNTSGFSWNDTNKTINAEHEVWQTYLEAHPDAKQYRS